MLLPKVSHRCWLAVSQLCQTEILKQARHIFPHGSLVFLLRSTSVTPSCFYTLAAVEALLLVCYPTHNMCCIFALPSASLCQVSSGAAAGTPTRSSSCCLDWTRAAWPLGTYACHQGRGCCSSHLLQDHSGHSHCTRYCRCRWWEGRG